MLSFDEIRQTIEEEIEACEEARRTAAQRLGLDVDKATWEMIWKFPLEQAVANFRLDPSKEWSWVEIANYLIKEGKGNDNDREYD